MSKRTEKIFEKEFEKPRIWFWFASKKKTKKNENVIAEFEIIPCPKCAKEIDKNWKSKIKECDDNY